MKFSTRNKNKFKKNYWQRTYKKSLIKRPNLLSEDINIVQDDFLQPEREKNSVNANCKSELNKLKISIPNENIKLLDENIHAIISNKNETNLPSNKLRKKPCECTAHWKTEYNANYIKYNTDNYINRQ